MAKRSELLAEIITLRQKIEEKMGELVENSDLEPEVAELQLLSEEIRSISSSYQNLRLKLVSKAQEGSFTAKTLVDLGFLLRQDEKHFDDQRKDAKATSELFGKRASLDAIRADVETVRGELATGTVMLQMRVNWPGPDSPLFAEMCEYFGVDKGTAQAKIFAPHYTKMGEWATRLAEEGKSLPSFIPESYPVHQMRFRGRKRSQ